MRYSALAATVIAAQLLSGCDRTEWTTVTEANEKFSIQMPSQPVRRVETKDYPGGKIRIAAYISKLSDDAAFGITATEYPDSVMQRLTVDQGLDAGVDAALKKYATAASATCERDLQGKSCPLFQNR